MEPQINFVVPLIIVLLESYVSGSCPENFYTSVDNLCCRLCQEGTFLKKPCNESKGTSFCEPCPHSTYMDNANNRTECEPCKQCGPSQIALVECGPNRNRECGCEPGKYHDRDYLFCMDCSKCPVGEGMVSPCSQTKNTKCQRCPKGTFSDKESFELPCAKCSKCEPAGLMVVKEECNASRDTICERTNVSLVMTETQNLASVTIANVPTSGGGRLQPITEEKGTSYQYIIPLIIVGIVICILLIAMFCFVMKRRRSNDNNTCHPPEELQVNKYDFPVPATSSETPAQARSSYGLRGRRTTTHTTSARSKSQHQRDSDSQGSSSSLQSVSIGNGKNKTLVRDLPGHIFIELGRLLNPKSFNNWIKLAGLLGFTNSHVKNFEMDPEVATQNLLHEWGQRDGTTVDVLIEFLKEMNRDDCLQVLKQWDS